MYMDGYSSYSDISSYPSHDFPNDHLFTSCRQPSLADMHTRHRSIGTSFMRSEMQGMDDFSQVPLSQVNRYPESIRGHQRMNSSPIFPSHYRSNTNPHINMRYIGIFIENGHLNCRRSLQSI